MTCKDKQENNGVCPHHNLQCGWPKCNELEQTPLAVISAKQLSAMFQNLKDVDQNQSGYHWRIGWNAALRQAMDYSMPPCTSPPPQRKPLTDEEIERACVPLGAAMLSFTEVARAIEAAHGIKEIT